MNFLPCKDNTSFGRILDRKSCLTILTSNPTDSPGQVFALQRLNIFNLKRLEIPTPS